MTSSSGSSTGGFNDGKYEINVDQDISSLAARTHAEQSGQNLSGKRRMMSQQDGEAPRRDLVTGVSTLEKVAQGGHGFQTVGLDLGTIGSRNNVDADFRRESSSGGGFRTSSSSSQNEQHSSGGQHSSASSGGQVYSSNSGSFEQTDGQAGYDYDEYEDFEEDQSQGGTHETSYGRNSNYASHTPHRGSLNVQHESINQKFKHYPQKRDVSAQASNDICKSTKCRHIRCIAGPLGKNTEALIYLRTRLVAHTLHKVCH